MNKLTFTDDLGNTVNLDKTPERIVSLVPSITKTVADLGGGDKIAGVTNFCKYPETVVAKAKKLGGPKRIKVDAVKELNPDIIFAVKEENNKDQITELGKYFPVFVFDINTVRDALKMIKTIASILDNPGQGEQVVKDISDAFNGYKPCRNETGIYLIWKEPWMAAGKDTFISSMMKVAGFENIIEGRYPVVSMNDLDRADVILLSTEPYHFTGEHKNELQKQFPDKKIFIVNGEIFSWYGTMMLKFIDYLRSNNL